MDQTAPMQRLMRYVPTVAKLQRMYAATRPSPFKVHGGWSLSAIGVCLAVIGVQGYYLSQCGARQCRRSATVSCHPAPAPCAAAADSAAVGQAQGSVDTARPVRRAGVAQTASLLLLVIGLLIAFHPHILYYELKRMGLARDSSPGRGGA